MKMHFDRGNFGQMVEVEAPYQVVGDILYSDLQFSPDNRARLLGWLANPGAPDEEGPPHWTGNAVGLEHHGDTVVAEHLYDGAPPATVSRDALAWAVHQWGDFVEGRLPSRGTVEGP